MRIFLTKAFAKFAEKERLTDAVLRDAVSRAEAGSVDAQLGSEVIKQRIARAGGGKSGGYRTIMVFRTGKRAIFAHGFAKKERDNISPEELRAIRVSARTWLRLTESEMTFATAHNQFREIAADG